MSADVKPFRFLDLPKEVRLVVYEHLFAGYVLQVGFCEDICKIIDEDTGPRQDARRSHEYLEARGWGRSKSTPALLGILATNKLIHAEAMSALQQWVSLDIGSCCFEETLDRIPSDLKHVKIVHIEDWYLDRFDHASYPDLHTLMITVINPILRPPYISNEEAVRDVIEWAMDDSPDLFAIASSRPEIEILLYCHFLGHPGHVRSCCFPFSRKAIIDKHLQIAKADFRTQAIISRHPEPPRASDL
ncbi:uncharacterized protein AB675_4797 [Cyphellophora attinorum]|uniref:Uncharacterized protein n=1 Tax=Cyphellophora attinorum TaxID=1664694 RepID=A0A0N0NIB3_9EURO|nr:uncharacterized protein AB675_4797 [Phialophora attinorum]KPI35641.1 hypothetical protein AB675_4797 [Phialophora attinorum]